MALMACKVCGVEVERKSNVQRYCPDCREVKRRERNQSPRYRAKNVERLRKNRQRPEFKARELARQRSPVYKAKRREYRRRPEVRARELAYQRRPEVKAKAVAYQQRPEVKARRKEYQREYTVRLMDPYVSGAFRYGTSLKPEDVPAEVIEIQRLLIQARRLLRAKENANERSD